MVAVSVAIAAAGATASATAFAQGAKRGFQRCAALSSLAEAVCPHTCRWTFPLASFLKKHRTSRKSPVKHGLTSVMQFRTCGRPSRVDSLGSQLTTTSMSGLALVTVGTVVMMDDCVGTGKGVLDSRRGEGEGRGCLRRRSLPTKSLHLA